MHRQFPGRNQRSKGITVKYLVQYSLLLGVCLWLLYQLKHSHENIQHDKPEASGLPEKLHVDEVMKLGRKGIQENRFEETAVFKAKIEEGEAEFEENEGEAGGVEETEKKEKGGSDAGDENEVEETESNEVRNPNEDETQVEETDQEVENVPEARENNYKADDASSAVTHDSQRRVSENDNESLEENGNSIRDLEEEVTGSENGNSNNTVAEGSIDHLMSSNLTDLAVENDDVTAKNATESSNSTVSTETTDPLDETVEEEEGMATTEASDHSLIEDDNASETNDEEDESERSDKDPIDDTDILNQTIDTIREVESGEANTE